MKRLLILALIGWVSTATAELSLTVEALFSGKAMVNIDGVRRLLTVDQPSPEGVLLISANSKGAVIEIDGERRSYALSGHINAEFSKPEKQTASVRRDVSGAYTTLGKINGRQVEFMLDTGATGVAMSAEEARRLGVDFKQEGRKLVVDTASGKAVAYEVFLEQVQVGEIVLRGVQAFVLEQGMPPKTLLGLSFLNRVKIEDRGSMLVLEKRL